MFPASDDIKTALLPGINQDGGSIFILSLRHQSTLHTTTRMPSSSGTWTAGMCLDLFFSACSACSQHPTIKTAWVPGISMPGRFLGFFQLLHQEPHTQRQGGLPRLASGRQVCVRFITMLSACALSLSIRMSGSLVGGVFLISRL